VTDGAVRVVREGGQDQWTEAAGQTKTDDIGQKQPAEAVPSSAGQVTALTPLI
jgi:hypothetical protein